MSYFPTDIPFMSDEELIKNGLKKPYKKPEIINSKDLVPVVRCENCIHWSDSNQCARPELSGSRWHDPKYFDTYPDDFCSYGERREE